MTENNLIYKALAACKEKPVRGFPTLIGPTRWGKTHTVREFAQRVGSPLVTINWQTETPEEVGGHPFKEKVGRNWQTGYTVPPAITAALNANGVRIDQPFVLFGDELDKAHNDVLSCLLTLTDPKERRLRHVTFSPDVFLVGAMNEPQRTLPEPFVARMLMLPFPCDYSAYVDGLPQDIQVMVREMVPVPKVAFPERPKSPGSFLMLREWFDCRDFWDDKAFQQLIVRGLFQEQQVPAVLEKLESDKPTANGAEWMKRATPQGVLKGLIRIMHASDLEGRKGIMQEFQKRVEADKTGEFLKLWDLFASDKHIEPRTCVGREMTLKPQFAREINGKKYRKTLEIGQAVFEAAFAEGVGG